MRDPATTSDRCQRHIPTLPRRLNDRKPNHHNSSAGATTASTRAKGRVRGIGRRYSGSVPFTVIYDACVLYPASLRDILIRVGQAGLVHVRWTDRILDECFRSILRNRPDLRPDRLQRTRQLMGEAIRDVVVEGYENLAAGLDLPDEDDRHVLAAAIKAGAQIIVTFNLRDFPPQQLGEIEAQAPDTFLYNLIDLSPGIVAHVIRSMEEDLGSRPGIDYVLATLTRAGLRKSMDAIRPYLS